MRSIIIIDMLRYQNSAEHISKTSLYITKLVMNVL